VTARSEVPTDVIDKLRAVCLDLPEAYEEEAWVGTRWRVRQRTFAHVLVLADGWPPAYARAAGIDGPACLLTFESAGAELDTLSAIGPPYFKPPWRPTVVGVILDRGVDWDEVAELLTESYCVLAPKALVARVDRPPPEPTP
jgi:hypothetical protein